MASLAILLEMAALVAFVAWIVTKEEIFKGLREKCAKLKQEEQTGWKKWVCEKIAYLTTCYFCFSCWTTVFVMLLFPVKAVSGDWRGYLFAFPQIVLIANVYLTSFNILRASLRFAQVKADSAELEKRRACEMWQDADE